MWEVGIHLSEQVVQHARVKEGVTINLMQKTLAQQAGVHRRYCMILMLLRAARWPPKTSRSPGDHNNPAAWPLRMSRTTTLEQCNSERLSACALSSHVSPNPTRSMLYRPHPTDIEPGTSKLRPYCQLRVRKPEWRRLLESWTVLLSSPRYPPTSPGALCLLPFGFQPFECARLTAYRGWTGPKRGHYPEAAIWGTPGLTRLRPGRGPCICQVALPQIYQVSGEVPLMGHVLRKLGS